MIFSMLADIPTWDVVALKEGMTAISFDAFISMEFKGEGRAASEPVEKGSFASYNKLVSPQELTVTLAQAGSPEEQETTLEYLNEIVAETDVLSLVTPAKEYSPFTLESYSYRRTEKDGASLLTVELKLMEVREVETQAKTTTTTTATQKPISQTSSKNASNASTTDTGKTQAKPPYTSVLASL